MLNLLWGVRAFYYNTKKSTDETIVEVNQLTYENGFVEDGDFIINLNAMPANAVSYTHLDVYKRQVSACAQRQPSASTSRCQAR